MNSGHEREDGARRLAGRAAGPEEGSDPQTERRSMAMEQKILIVDDRPENLLALERILEPSDAEVVRATSGEGALACVLEHRFALALLDVRMPGMDGYELAGLLRGDPATRNMPIIFLTAELREAAQVCRGYRSGAVDYLVKPFEPDLLLAKVKVFLDLDRARRELEAHRDRLDQLVRERTAELEAANQSLQRSNDELARFAYVASHDLREPLRMVTSYTQLLARRYRGRLDDEAETFIRFAVDGATWMERLIEDLLAYSRIDTRARPPEPVDSGEVLRSTLENLDRLVQKTGARIEASDLPEVMVDPIQLGQVFQNLIGNALKFRGEEPPVVQIEARRDDGCWSFRVRDNGIGIHPEYHERIFTVFQRLHAREAYGGSGIGLAICRKIVERHGGTIRVESTDGEGATFVFTLPAATSGHGSKSRGAPASATPERAP